MLVKDIMTKDVITVSPDSMLKDVGKILREKRISGIPVIETGGKIAGIVTVNDILRILEEIYQWQDLEKNATGLNLSDLVGKERLNTKVKSIMTKNVYTLDENKDVGEAMRLMFTKKIHTIPITKNGLLVGVIGKRDIVYNCF
ncbi:MAG: CBS domain-containing protein [Candidatus Omnitrophica bacterium]|nr:CBS domain-containing protein [Candidatus Omnitrophota bacterium]